MAKGKGKRKVGAGDVASNRYASHRYQLLERLECGVVLEGTEVKALRSSGAQLVPTRIYFTGARAKVEIALARGKDLYDKRQTMRERETKRDMERAVREARR